MLQTNMFGMNEIVGRKYFRNAPKNSLKVTSRFYTIQGEGPWSGYPAYFIRLAKCNLNCSFCDTYFDDGNYLTFDEIFDQMEIDIAKFYSERNMERPYWTKADEDNRKIILVITGGEPTLQPNLAAFLDMAINEKLYITQIESNGILMLDDINFRTTYVVSPKCSEKNGQSMKYIRPNKEVLANADCLKFVMSAEHNSPYRNVPDWAHEWAKEKDREVFVSPMNIYKKEPQKAKELRESTNQISIEERSTIDEVISFWEPDLLDMKVNQLNHEYTAEYAMKYGFVLNLQTHLFASLP